MKSVIYLNVLVVTHIRTRKHVLKLDIYNVKARMGNRRVLFLDKTLGDFDI